MAGGRNLRRSLLPLLLVLPACSAEGTAEPPAAPAATDRTDVGFRRIAPGVWLHSTYHEVPGFGRVLSNGLVVENAQGSVLVDTAWDDAQTRAILDWARGTLRKPVTAAIVTHAHADKMGGMAALHAAGVTTFANRRSNEDAPARGLVPARLPLDFTADGELAPASAEAVGRALSPLRIAYPGGGHTRDNIVVGIRGSNVVFGGCLIRPGDAADLGNTGDADLAHWADSAEAVGKAFPQATIIVPSHGPPAGRELLALTARLARQAAQP
ncbi:MAG: subclass B1 metallo-beta-lactamase [Novosphingobium sp.]|nr:subclass B1 metallo-beta-lactamase [Novosphingobium sp.]